jgi:hypothetical protein
MRITAWALLILSAIGFMAGGSVLRARKFSLDDEAWFGHLCGAFLVPFVLLFMAAVLHERANRKSAAAPKSKNDPSNLKD